jgi:molybdenum-dependent DNA-binding transcriptional regulator ModE
MFGSRFMLSQLRARYLPALSNTSTAHLHRLLHQDSRAAEMTFEQIRYFLMLADEGSFIRAARRCGISQPSLTNAIKSLERSLGAPLFDRTIKGSELTAFGKALHPPLVRLDHARFQVMTLAARVNSSSKQVPAATKQDRPRENYGHRSSLELLSQLDRKAISPR